MEYLFSQRIGNNTLSYIFPVCYTRARCNRRSDKNINVPWFFFSIIQSDRYLQLFTPSHISEVANFTRHVADWEYMLLADPNQTKMYPAFSLDTPRTNLVSFWYAYCVFQHSVYISGWMLLSSTRLFTQYIETFLMASADKTERCSSKNGMEDALEQPHWHKSSQLQSANSAPVVGSGDMIFGPRTPEVSTAICLTIVDWPTLW